MAERPLKVPIFVVVRVDEPIERHDAEHLRNRVTLVESFPTAEEAESEVQRLARLNSDKGCVYFWTPTRYFPAGRGVQEGY